MHHAIDTVIMAIKETSTLGALMTKSSRLEDDIRHFLREQWAERMAEQARQHVLNAASTAQVPINSATPLFFKLSTRMLYDGTPFREQYRRKLKDVDPSGEPEAALGIPGLQFFAPAAKKLAQDAIAVMNGHQASESKQTPTLEPVQVVAQMDQTSLLTLGDSGDYLATPAMLQEIIRYSASVLCTKQCAEAVVPFQRDNIISDFETSSVNHALFHHARSAIVMFALMMQLMLPKVSLLFSTPEFLKTSLFDKFFDQIGNLAKGAALSKIDIYALPGSTLCPVAPESPNPPSRRMSFEEKDRFLKDRYMIEAPRADIEAAMMKVRDKNKELQLAISELKEAVAARIASNDGSDGDGSDVLPTSSPKPTIAATIAPAAAAPPGSPSPQIQSSGLFGAFTLPSASSKPQQRM
jgi:hypothetical protein